MSWLFSQALVVEYSVENSLDGEHLSPLSVMPTRHKFWRNDKTMEFSRLSRFGLTCVVLTESRGMELLTLFLEGFRVKTSAARGGVLELGDQKALCGKKWQESLMKYDLHSHGWKTHQCLEQEDLPLSLVTLPKSGMMQNGVVFLPQKSEPTTKGIACGYLLPTPTCHNAKEGAYPAEYTRNTPTLATHVGGKIHPGFTERMMGWPIGWTDLEPLGMDKFQEWLDRHS